MRNSSTSSRDYHAIARDDRLAERRISAGGSRVLRARVVRHQRPATSRPVPFGNEAIAGDVEVQPLILEIDRDVQV